MGASCFHSAIKSARRASIQSRPPSRSVARDSRRTMRSPSNSAMVNLVPPTSMASVFIGLAHFVGRRGARSFFHDRDGGNEIAESCGVMRGSGGREGDGCAGGKTIARAADVDGPSNGDGGHQMFAALIDYDNAARSLGNEHQLCAGVLTKGLVVGAANGGGACLGGFAFVRLKDRSAKEVGSHPRIHPHDFARIFTGDLAERIANARCDDTTVTRLGLVRHEQYVIAGGGGAQAIDDLAFDRLGQWLRTNEVDAWAIFFTRLGVQKLGVGEGRDCAGDDQEIW